MLLGEVWKWVMTRQYHQVSGNADAAESNDAEYPVQALGKATQASAPEADLNLCHHGAWPFRVESPTWNHSTALDCQNM